MRFVSRKYRFILSQPARAEPTVAGSVRTAYYVRCLDNNSAYPKTVIFCKQMAF